MPAVDGGEHLSGDNATDDTVSDHQDGVQDGDQLRWPVSHYISSDNLERPFSQEPLFLTGAKCLVLGASIPMSDCHFQHPMCSYMPYRAIPERSQRLSTVHCPPSPD